MLNRDRAGVFNEKSLHNIKIAFGLAMCSAVLLALPVLSATVPVARAYGSAALWQVAVSQNCNSPSFCTPFQGGFWLWAEFDSDGTGDATGTGCGHLVAAGSPGAGADHFNADIQGWTVMPGSAGPLTFFVLGGTMTLTGHTGGPPVTVPIGPLPLDTGIPAVAGHFTAFDVLGFNPPPGVSFIIQVVSVAH